MKKMVIILCIVILGIAFLAMPVAAQTCGEDILSDQCECNSCPESLNLQVTPTCDGLELTWNNVGAKEYTVIYNYPNGGWGGVS